MKKKVDIKHRRRVKAAASVLLAVLLLFSLTGCTATVEEGVPTTLEEAVLGVQSVEASISFELQGSFSGSGSRGPDAHTVSVRSDGTITSNFSPLPDAYHSEFYSSILVDGATTRESREKFVVPDVRGYVTYEYLESADEWHRSTLSRSDEKAVRREMAFFSDWPEFMGYLTLGETQDLPNGNKIYVYNGDVPACYLQEIFGNNVFGSLMYSMEQLLNDEIPCKLTVNGQTLLPDTLTFTFENAWRVSDMDFDIAEVNVYYSKYNQIQQIEADKKVAVRAIDAEEEFYSTYYAWNLFLPYVGGQIASGGSAGNAGQSFAAEWNTFQVRLDGGMTKVPLPFEDLSKLGYTIEDNFASIIVEPNKYKEGVIVQKGSDRIICTFYNDDTVPQPIIKCKIGCLDLSASNVPQNGIQMYLPGEVTLGITKDALLSAYDEATEVNTAFSCDTYTWRGEGSMQSFMAEISPVTGQVIRLQIKNIPVTGGAQI